jgi:hypothetical protein
MTSSPDPDWDTTVLEHPTVLTLPDHAPTGAAPEHADPRLATAAQAIAAQLRGDPAETTRLAGRLGRAGIVAVRTGDGVLEIRETAAGWRLLACAGEPDPADLGVAARLRAYHLARLRRHDAGGGQPA